MPTLRCLYFYQNVCYESVSQGTDDNTHKHDEDPKQKKVIKFKSYMVVFLLHFDITKEFDSVQLVLLNILAYIRNTFISLFTSFLICLFSDSVRFLIISLSLGSSKLYENNY